MVPLNQNELFFLLFDYYNKALFNNELEKSFMRMSKRKILGFFSLKKETEEDSSEQSLDCDSKEVHISVIHELIHRDLARQKKSSGNGYHSKIFTEAAKEKGLSTFNIKEPGKETGDDVGHLFISEGVSQAAYELFQKGIYEYKPLPVTETSDTKKRKKLIKYECLSCYSSMWGKRNIIDICWECFELRIPQGIPEEEWSPGYYVKVQVAKTILALLKELKNRLYSKVSAEYKQKVVKN